MSLLAAFMLTACLDEAESSNAKTISASEAICTGKKFPASQMLQDAGKYSRVCRLSQLSGIKIDGVKTIYLCQSELLSDDFPSDGKSFAAKEVKAIFGKSAEKADILATGGFIGKKFALLILGGEGNSTIIATHDDMAKLNVTIETPQAAIAWAYLSGNLGRGMASGFAPKAMCSAKIRENSNGWLLNNANVFENCQPKEMRDIQITKTGQVRIVKKTVNKDEPALCID